MAKRRTNTGRSPRLYLDVRGPLLEDPDNLKKPKKSKKDTDNSKKLKMEFLAIYHDEKGNAQKSVPIEFYIDDLKVVDKTVKTTKNGKALFEYWIDLNDIGGKLKITARVEGKNIMVSREIDLKPQAGRLWADKRLCRLYRWKKKWRSICFHIFAKTPFYFLPVIFFSEFASRNVGVVAGIIVGMILTWKLRISKWKKGILWFGLVALGYIQPIIYTSSLVFSSVLVLTLGSAMYVFEETDYEPDFTKEGEWTQRRNAYPWWALKIAFLFIGFHIVWGVGGIVINLVTGIGGSPIVIKPGVVYTAQHASAHPLLAHLRDMTDWIVYWFIQFIYAAPQEFTTLFRKSDKSTEKFGDIIAKAMALKELGDIARLAFGGKTNENNK